MNGFRLNKNGKPILLELNDITSSNFKGHSYKENGEYFFFKRKLNSKFIYSR
jgi:hypothetical protein